MVFSRIECFPILSGDVPRFLITVMGYYENSIGVDVDVEGGLSCAGEEMGWDGVCVNTMVGSNIGSWKRRRCVNDGNDNLIMRTSIWV